MKADDIDTTYDDICKKYFPRWKPCKIILDETHGAGHGSYNPENKTICVGSNDPTLIIHEICHAVCDKNTKSPRFGAGHNMRFQKRMLKVIEESKTHDPKLSISLIKDLKHIMKIQCIAIYIGWDKLILSHVETLFTGIYINSNVLKEDIDIDKIVTSFLKEHGITEIDGIDFFNELKQMGIKIAEHVRQEAVDKHNRVEWGK